MSLLSGVQPNVKPRIHCEIVDRAMIMWTLILLYALAVSVTLSVTGLQMEEPRDTRGEERPLFEKCNLDMTRASDEILNQCIQDALDSIRPRLSTGIPALGLPPLDPYEFGDLYIEEEYTHEQMFGSSSTSTSTSSFGLLSRGSSRARTRTMAVNLNLTEIWVQGLTSDSTIEIKVKSDDADGDRRILYEFRVPELLIDGNYSLFAEGVPIFRRIRGEGPFWMEVIGLNVHGTQTQDGANFNETVIVTGIKFELQNLFNGNAFLGAAVNRRLNAHSLALFEQIKPQLAAEIGALVSKITDSIFKQLQLEIQGEVKTETETVESSENLPE